MLIPNPILIDTTPAGGLILPVVAGRGGLSGYVLLGLSGPATAERSTDSGATWATLIYPTTLAVGQQLRLTRTDTGALLGTLRALAPVDEETPPGSPTTMPNGVPLSGLSGVQESLTLYTLEIPAGTGQLTVTTSGGTGDLDLFVRRGQAPVPGSSSGEPVADGVGTTEDTSDETVTLGSPQVGTWYVWLYAYVAYSGVTLTATWA